MSGADTRRIFHYNCDNVHDAGWGCVYRSFQNACMLVGAPPPEMEIFAKTMARMLGRPYGTWIEPAHLEQYARRHRNLSTCDLCVRAELLLGKSRDVGALCKVPRLSKVDEYGKFPFTATHLHRILTDTSRRCAAILDDGTFGFCVYYGHSDECFLVIDPHATPEELSAKRLVRAYDNLSDFLVTAPAWMVAVVEKK